MTIKAKRIFAAAIATICLTLGAAGTAAADPGNGHGPPCFGPPGQTIVPFERQMGPPGQVSPPGQQVSSCAQGG